MAKSIEKSNCEVQILALSLQAELASALALDNLLERLSEAMKLEKHVIITVASIFFAMLVNRAELIAGDIKSEIRQMNNNLAFQTQQMSDWYVEEIKNKASTSTQQITTVKTVTRDNPNPYQVTALLHMGIAFMFMHAILSLRFSKK